MMINLPSQSTITLTQDELYCAYEALARATRYPKSLTEKRLLNKTLLKIDKAIFATKHGVNK